jgi:hypothetical protein
MYFISVTRVREPIERTQTCVRTHLLLIYLFFTEIKLLTMQTSFLRTLYLYIEYTLNDWNRQCTQSIGVLVRVSGQDSNSAGSIPTYVYIFEWFKM